MATKTAKKKSAKKKATTRTAKKLKPSERAKKKETPKSESNGQASPPIQKMAFDFPERDETIELRIAEYMEAERVGNDQIAKANDRMATSHKALKESIRAAGLDSYSSYDVRKVVELKHLDDKLKLRDVKKKEATPCATAGVVSDQPDSAA